jgi:hypothetical protein
MSARPCLGFLCVLNTFVVWGCSQSASKTPGMVSKQVVTNDASPPTQSLATDSTIASIQPDAAPPVAPVQPAPKQSWKNVSLAKADRAPRLANLRLDVACKVDADCGVLNTVLTGIMACCTPGSCREVVVANKRSIALLTKRCQQDQLLRKPKPEGWYPCPPWDCNEMPEAQCENKVDFSQTARVTPHQLCQAQCHRTPRRFQDAQAQRTLIGSARHFVCDG